jgi:hypothetical protein
MDKDKADASMRQEIAKIARYDAVDKLIALARRWTSLDAEERAIHFRRAQLLAEARGCFSDDRKYNVWLRTCLNFNAWQVEEAHLRVVAARIVKDQRTWDRVGGHTQIARLRGLPQRDQVAVLESAKSTNRSIRTLVQERVASKPSSEVKPMKKAPRDVAVLARFIAENIRSLPPLPRDVEDIVRIYEPGALA